MLTVAKAAATTMPSTATPAAMTTTTLTALAVTGSDQQVRTLIPVTTASGGRLVLAGPCILLKTSLPTVAQHLQALRPLLKADGANRNNNNSNSATTATTSSNTTAVASLKTAACSRGKGLRGGLKKEAAPAAAGNEPAALRCKRRIDFDSLGLPRPLPATMARRNERERNRVKQVNLGFETLRQHVPTGRKTRKLSKVDTLKEAVSYIRHLQQLLRDSDDNDGNGGFRSVIADTIDLASRGAALTSARASDVASCPQDAARPAAAADELSPMTLGGAGCFCSSSVTSGLEADVFADGGELPEVDFDCDMSPMTEDDEEEEEDDVSSITPTLTLIPEIETLTSGSPFSHLAGPPSPGSPPSPPAPSYVPLHDGVDRQADWWCGGSDGASCPVSPSQSSCGASETSFEESFSCSSSALYEDFTSDLAEWLCAKFDIKEGDTIR